MIATDSETVNRHMLALSTYLGHNRVSNTYRYLEATPPLLKTIAEAMGLKSLKEAIDTDSSTGQIVFHIFGHWPSSSEPSSESARRLAFRPLGREDEKGATETRRPRSTHTRRGTLPVVKAHSEADLRPD